MFGLEILIIVIRLYRKSKIIICCKDVFREISKGDRFVWKLFIIWIYEVVNSNSN